jgi:hypothetical protein
MTGVLNRLGVKRAVTVWLIAALLWLFRAAFCPWVWLAVLLILYCVLGFLAFGRVIPAGIAAVGSAGSAWLHIQLYRELAAASEKTRCL